VVDPSNLQRQILHATDRIGLPKVESASIAIGKLNPSQGRPAPDAPVVGQRPRIIKDYDLIVDGADNSPPLPVNDAALKLTSGRARQHLSLRGAGDDFVPYEARATAASTVAAAPTWRRRARRRACSRALRVIGSLQANEAIKLPARIGKSMAGDWLMFGCARLKFRERAARTRPADLR